MAGKIMPGLGKWSSVPGKSGRGKGMKNKRKAKRRLAQLAVIRKRMAAERAKRAEEMGGNFEEDWGTGGSYR
jgi:hypothetical protein